jgi:hypothetical protein
MSRQGRCYLRAMSACGIKQCREIGFQAPPNKVVFNGFELRFAGAL